MSATTPNTATTSPANVTSGPLTAPAAGNGVYTYSSNSAFPTNTFSGTNYWVDVMFNPFHRQSAAGGRERWRAHQRHANSAATIAASSLTANDSDPDGDPLTITGVSAAVNGTVVLNTQPNPQNNTVTFTPTPAIPARRASATRSRTGAAAQPTANVSLTVAPPGAAPVSLFSASNMPAQTNLNDGTQLEVGMKFTSSAAGQITALKFYRSAGDTGTDVLDLWSATGTKLASATFTNTAASGWQTVTLPTAGLDRRQHHLCCLLPHDRRLCGDQQLLHHAPSPTAR